MFPRQVRAVVFDMDGLLVDSEVAVRQALFDAAQAMGYEMSQGLFLQMLGRPRAENRRLAMSHFGEAFPYSDWEERVGAQMRAAVICLKAGVIELLDHLDQQRLPRAIATSSNRFIVDRHLGDHDLAARFDAIVAAEDVERHKPYPDPYLKAAELLGVEPQHCLALEDSHNGVRAAHAAGMMTVMVPDLLEPTDEMHGLCVHIAETLHAVEAMLKANGGKTG